MTSACSIRVRGVVQGVGFRPFVYRLARANTLAGWVLNGDEGVEIHLEGDRERAGCLSRELRARRASGRYHHRHRRRRRGAERARRVRHPRRASRAGSRRRASRPTSPSARAVSTSCSIRPTRAIGYPYINCTDCGPRYSIIRRLALRSRRDDDGAWPMDDACAREYHDPGEPSLPRPAGGVSRLRAAVCVAGTERTERTAGQTAQRTQRRATTPSLRRPRCSATARSWRSRGSAAITSPAMRGNATAVAALRERKFRKEKPFALMARDLRPRPLAGRAVARGGGAAGSPPPRRSCWRRPA